MNPRTDGHLRLLDSAVEAGTQIGEYRVRKALFGQPGLYDLYEAEHTSGEIVSLKLLSQTLTQDREFRRRLRRAARSRAQIHHPHLVPFYGAGDSDHGLYLVMALAAAPTLGGVLRGPALDVTAAVSALSQVASALDAAHHGGLIDRDLDPDNILVDYRGGPHALLTDLGIGKPPSRSGLFELVEAPHYLSPEEVRGDPLVPQSNVYSLGCILHHCLTHSPPFELGHYQAILYAHLAEEPPRVTSKRKDLPAAIDEITAKAMAKEPDGRFESAGELMRAVADALDLGPKAGAAALPIAITEAEPDKDLSSAWLDAEDETDGRQSAVGSRQDEGAVEVEVEVEEPEAEVDEPEPEPEPEPAVEVEEPVAEPEPSGPSGRRLRVAARALALGAVLAAAGVGGYLVGTSGPADLRAPDRVASAGLALDLPPGWERLPVSDAGVPGLVGGEALAAHPQGQSGVSLVAVRSRPAGPSLLPASFTSLLAKPPERNDPVHLGPMEAWRYRDLAPRGLRGELTVYAAPTDAGSLTIACRAPAASATDACERAASTLRSPNVRPVSLDRSAAWLRELNRTTRTLSRRRAAGRRALARARTPGGQARAGRRLARSYTTALRRLAKFRPGPELEGARAAVASGLRRSGRAYSFLAASARASRRGAYRQGRGRVARAESSLQDALRAVRSG